MAVAAPADRRFRRSQVSPARRARLRENWRKLAGIVVVSIAAVVAMYAVAARVLASDAFTVREITVTGNSRISRGEVVALLDGLHGAHLLAIELDGWRRKLLESPWVAEAHIRRVFPGTLAVAISERQPLGIGRINDQLFLIDRDGVVIDEYGPHYTGLDLPIIDGLAAHAASDGLLVDERRAALAGRLLAALATRPDLARRVSQIDVSDARDAVVIFQDDTALVRVGEERFVERLQAYVDLAPTLRDRVPDIDYVDLRFDERVYVRPQSTSRAQKNQKGLGG